MPFMLLIFCFLLVAVLWAFFHYRPRGVNRSALTAFNVATVVLALPVSVLVGMWIYSAAADMPEKQKLAAYLAVMAGGTAYLALVSIAGLIRNLFLFPLSRRKGRPEDHQVV
jgi:hypothetical protein